MKYFLTLFAFFISSISQAELHYSKDGDVLDPGMYWAIHARNELSDIKEGKGNKEKMMNNLKVSATYGFKPAMLSMSAIYQNGDYGFEKDLSKAYAWWILSMGNSVNSHADSIELFKATMTTEENIVAEELFKEYSVLYSQKATIRKFEKWFAEATAVTGSRLGGDHSYLNLQVLTSNGRNVSASEYFKRLNEIQDARLNELYKVVPQEIKIKNDDKVEKEGEK
jgi:hypothetical protein